VAINHVKKKYPNAPLYGLGISFGGNILLKYAGQEKEKCLFNSIVTVANPFNLSVCAEQIHKPKRFIYHNRLLWAFLTVIRQNEEQLRKNPKINVGKRKNYLLLV
jgi:predicted alpha/beta-fold hydrolase